MPRRGRLHIPGGCYHVIGRGLERRYIFADAADKRDFLSRFGLNIQASGSQCLAWALMSNHYHFLIRAGSQPLGKLMSPVLGGFAGNYNRRHNRCGYVFQNRFSSILCDEDNYLLELVRYIHLNPVRANMVDGLKQLSKYPWTGHAGLIGKQRQNWHAIDEVLCQFGTSTSHARKKYLKFIQDGLGAQEEMKLSGGGLVRSYGGWEAVERLRKEHIICIGDERILGDSDFVERVLREDELAIESKSRLDRDGWDLEKLIQHVCDRYELEECDILGRSRENSVSTAKTLICYLGNASLGIKSTTIARRLGISQPAVSKWISKGEKASEGEYWMRLLR